MSVASAKPVLSLTTGPVLDGAFEEAVDLVGVAVDVDHGDAVGAGRADHRERGVHADELEQFLLGGACRPAGDVAVEHGRGEGWCHLLRWWQRGVEHVVDGGVGDGGQQVFAFVLGELVLVER